MSGKVNLLAVSFLPLDPVFCNDLQPQHANLQSEHVTLCVSSIELIRFELLMTPPDVKLLYWMHLFFFH